MSGAQSDHAQKAGKDRDMSATVAVSISWNAMPTGVARNAFDLPHAGDRIGNVHRKYAINSRERRNKISAVMGPVLARTYYLAVGQMTHTCCAKL
jgi:hypothetical protein